MKPERALQVFLFPVAIALMAMLVVVALAPHGLATTPDSISYLDMAMNIRDGKGAQMTDLSWEHIEEQKVLLPQHLWPPLYPALLSLVIDDLSDVKGALQLSVLLLVVTALMIYGILLRHTQPFIALLGSLLFCLTEPVMTVYCYAWSETLFVPILLFSVFAFMESLETPGKHRLMAILGLMLALVALAYTRYIGIAMAVYLPAAWLCIHPKSKEALLILAAMVIYAVTVGSMLLENLEATGYLSGGERQSSDLSLFDNAADVAAMGRALLPSLPVLAGLLLAMFLLSIVIRQKSFPVAGCGGNQRAMWVFFASGCWYLLTLVAFRSNADFDRLDMRLLAPAFPLFWIALTLVAAQMPRPKNAGYWLMSIVAAVLLLGMSWNGYHYLQVTQQGWSEQGKPLRRMNAGHDYNNYTLPDSRLPQRKYLQQLLPDNALIVGRNPSSLAFAFGRPARALPGEIGIDELRRLNRLPAGSILLFDKVGNDPFLALRANYKIQYQVIDLGDWVVLALPVHVQKIE